MPVDRLLALLLVVFCVLSALRVLYIGACVCVCIIVCARRGIHSVVGGIRFVFWLVLAYPDLYCRVDVG